MSGFLARLRISSRSDEGSALVAAIGVAMIGFMLSVVVVGVAIATARDSGRDRVRTIEIHAAESVLDEAILGLEEGSPCTFSPEVVGGGATSIDVAVDVDYFDDAGSPLTTCAGGQIVGTPAKAILTATGTSQQEMVGIEPSRSILAEVRITPIETEEAGSAIFSAGAFSTGAGFSMSALNPSDHARVWIDSGNWTCSTSVTIDGDLVVPSGKVNFQNGSCMATGDVWAKTGFYSCCPPSGTFTIGGNLTVYSGNLTIDNPQKFGGNVSIGGTISTGGHWNNTTVAGTVCSNNVGSPCGELENYLPVGLPEIDYVPSDWTGFVVKQPADFATLVKTAWGIAPGSWQESSIDGQPCSPPGWMSSNPINLTSTETIYNMTSCTFGSGSGGGLLTLKVYADTVFFSKSFSAPNGLKIQSGDGQPHTIYFIVPEGGTANNGIAESSCRGSYCPGNIGFTSGGIQVQEPMSIFLYTPAQLQFPNTSNTRGQMYAGTVTVGAGSGVFKYESVALPGGYLTSSESSSEGSTIEIISKREQ